MSNFLRIHLQSPNLPLLSLSMITSSSFLFFFLLIPFATSLEFSLPSITPDNSLASNSINCTGDAYISINGIQLTPDPSEFYANTSSLQHKIGRATYFQPLHLWDSATGNIADFSTNFTFVIQGEKYGEGITFFLAPNGSNIPPDSGGGGLGLVNENGTSKFVAVEFDTYRNTWEPSAVFPINHVGINIDKMWSVVNQYWASGISDGKTNEARIKYDSSNKNLSVDFTYFENGDAVFHNLYYLVDLSAYLPEWVTFGFSGSTGTSYEKNSIKSWEFSTSLSRAEEGGKEAAKGGKKTVKTGLVVGLSVGFGVSVLIGLISWGLWRKSGGRKQEESIPIRERSMDDEFKRGTGARKFSYEELELATQNFSEEMKLGAGGFGGVYRGFLKELNLYVAVKRVSSGSKQGLKEYTSEVKIISQLRHRNLVQLMGWCHDKGELLLVYEFMPNRSLDSHLFKAESLLPWDIRYQIAQGLASALFYLHEEWEWCVVHRDIKSSNVMLDSNFTAKLGDFGLARLVNHEEDLETTVVAGTRGYMAPECLVTGKASKESDVYSFGVVALEIACGRRPIEPNAQQNEVKMVDWVWELYGNGKILEAVDPRLGDDYDEKSMECLMVVGLWCANPDWVLRPSIRQAILVLNFEAPLPVLPQKMPVPSSFGPQGNSFGSYVNSSLYGSESSSQVQSSSYSGNSNNSVAKSLPYPAAPSAVSASYPLRITT